jgi:hypothetical protein
MDAKGALVMGLGADEFVTIIEKRRIQGPELSEFIRAALKDLLGEISATASLAYVGDASNGDVRGFAHRADELFGTSSGLIFSHIVVMAEKRNKRVVA